MNQPGGTNDTHNIGHYGDLHNGSQSVQCTKHLSVLLTIINFGNYNVFAQKSGSLEIIFVVL